MSLKPVKEHKGSKSTQANDQLHKPIKHIKETARLAGSVEPNKEKGSQGPGLGAVPYALFLPAQPRRSASLVVDKEP